MITSKREYEYYLEADRIALDRKKKGGVIGTMNHFFFPDYIWLFQKRLRKFEFLLNTQSTIYSKARCKIAYWRYRRLGVRLGFTIPPNVFGPGLSIAHQGTIVVNTGARVGANCRLHVDINIGTAAGFENKAPQIGNNVYIGPGAKIFGAIQIADNVAIGANAVVNKTFGESGVVIGGVPAKVIGTIDTKKILIIATDVLNISGREIR